ncbi:MAG: DUF342 domain-containing protein [Lachnospiraceae bacterium]|nr:DUF342 domain-containing protein [Lachnospiraceae bacterium]
MSDKNGYFRVQVNKDGTFLTVYPPEGKGAAVSLHEAEEYLRAKSIEYSPVQLNSLVKTNVEKTLLLQKQPYKYKINEEVVLTVSQDKMTVYARFYPPAAGGTEVNQEEIEKDLVAKQIKAPLFVEGFKQFEQERNYCTNYVVAKGEAPKDGKNGYVEYLFNTDLSVKPKINEDGSVDFHNLNTVCSVAKGQKLAILHPEEKGQFGTNVYGDIIQPKVVEHVQLKYGRDIELSEDRLSISSKIDGHVNLINGEIFVSGVLEMKEVGPETGNIENFEGSMLVKGNVRAGYKLKCSGDIEIQGVIEGAEVVAGGQISVARGINGMGNGYVKAGTNVIAKYIENTEVEAGNYVHSEVILNSTVTAKTNVSVTGKKGFISGSTVRAGKEVSAISIGSDMGTDTIIEVGMDPAKKKQLINLQQENQDLTKQAAQIQPVLASVQQKLKKGEKLDQPTIARMKLLSETLQKGNKKIEENKVVIHDIEEEMYASRAEAVVKVKGKIFPGTKLTVGDVTEILKKPYQYCRFVRKGADISMQPMN